MAIEAAVAKLQAQHESMGNDINFIKSALASIDETLKKFTGIEQRQVHLTESITRAHSRVDELQIAFKDEVKGHEKRIQSIEISIAKNQWIERVIMTIIMGVVGLWIKGGF